MTKDDAPDLSIIVADAKKDPAYAKMTGKKGPKPEATPDGDEGEDDESAKEDQYLRDVFAALKGSDEAAFVEAMSAWRHDCAPMK